MGRLRLRWGDRDHDAGDQGHNQACRHTDTHDIAPDPKALPDRSDSAQQLRLRIPSTAGLEITPGRG